MSKESKKQILQNLLKKLLDKNLSKLEQNTKDQIKVLSSTKELTTKMEDILSEINKKKNPKKKLFSEKDLLNKAYQTQNKSKIKSNILNNNNNNTNKNNINKKNPSKNKTKQISKPKKINYYKNIQNNYQINLFGDNINIISNDDKINYTNYNNTISTSHNRKFSLKKIKTMFNLYKKGTKNKFFNDNSLINNQVSRYKSNNTSVLDLNEIASKSVRKKSLTNLKKNILNPTKKIIRKKTPCRINNEKKKIIGNLKLNLKHKSRQSSIFLNNNLNIKKIYGIEKKENKIINDILLLNSSINKVDSMIMNYNLLSLEDEDFEKEIDIINKNISINNIINTNNNYNYIKSILIEDFIDNGYFNYILDYLPIEDLINIKKASKYCNNFIIKYFIEKLEKEKNKFIKKISNNDIKLKDKNNYKISLDKLNLNKTSEKAINLLNENSLNKLFYNNIIPNDDILLIYRIFFNIINHPIKDINIKDKIKFWEKCRNYFIKEGQGKIGKIIFDIIKEKKICLNGKNIYNVYHLIENNLNKIIPSYFSKICGTTGLFVFFIKDVLDFLGITNDKNNSNNSFACYSVIIDYLNEKINILKLR